MKKDYSHPEAFSTFLNSEFIQIANIQYRAGAYYFGKHMHSNLEIYRLLEGSCQMEIGSTSISCVKDDFVIIMPNIVHSLFLSEGTDCTFEHIHFSPELPAERPDLLLSVVLPYTGGLFYQRPGFRYRPRDGTGGNVLPPADESSDVGAADPSSPALRQGLFFLHSEIFCPEYVRSVGASVYRTELCRQNRSRRYRRPAPYLLALPEQTFQKHTNMTLLNYINVFRMNQAILLMTDPQLTLTEIASRVGMNDSQHFSKLFKSIIGSSPSLFRKTLSNEEQRQEWIPLGYQEPRKD